MDLKSIVITASNDPRYLDCLDLAFALADDHDAHLTVVHALPSPRDLASSGRGASAAYVEARMETAVEQDKELEHRTRAHAKSKKRQIEWVSGVDGLQKTVAREALLADLTIVGRSENAIFEDWVRDHLVDYLTRAVDVPVLYAPPTGDYRSAGQNVMIAWDGSSPAMRAVRAALPIVARAKAVHVVSLGPIKSGSMETGQSLVEYLAQHGVKAKLHGNETAGTAIGPALLQMADALKADLIVMGAHSKAKLREILFGSVTRTLLADSTKPILLSG